MSYYFVKTPGFVKLLFRNWIWNYSRSKKSIYLTFDDGPTEAVTPWVLNVLKKHNAKATFFCIGKNVAANPDIYKEVLSQGHSIGNHTYNHLNGLKTSTPDYLHNVQKANNMLTGMQSIFRPPYGKMTRGQTKEIVANNLKIVGWDVLSADFDTKISKEKCFDNVIKNTENGSIVVFHDSLKAEKNLKYVLPKVLDYFSALNYEFKKIEA